MILLYMQNFKKYCAKLHHHPHRNVDELAPFCQQTCIYRYSSNRMTPHKESQFVPSIHNLLHNKFHYSYLWDGGSNRLLRSTGLGNGLTRRWPATQASFINMLNIKTDKPRSKRNIFICKPVEYVSTKKGNQRYIIICKSVECLSTKDNP